MTIALADGNKQVNDDLHKAEKNQTNILADEAVNEDVSKYEEYEVIEKEMDVDGLVASVVEDNQAKRIILFADEDGEEQFKSIYTKKTGHVKIISFDKGQVFTGNVKGDATTDNDKEFVSEREKTETSVISDHIDLNKYTGKVVKENKNKGVIVYEDADGTKQYKSIFVKSKIA